MHDQHRCNILRWLDYLVSRIQLLFMLYPLKHFRILLTLIKSLLVWETFPYAKTISGWEPSCSHQIHEGSTHFVWMKNLTQLQLVIVIQLRNLSEEKLAWDSISTRYLAKDKREVCILSQLKINFYVRKRLLQYCIIFLIHFFPWLMSLYGGD